MARRAGQGIRSEIHVTRLSLKLLAAVFFSQTLSAMAAQAVAASPVGVWTTIDDETGQPQSRIAITEVHGELRGRIVESLEPMDTGIPEPRCEHCEGSQQNQPIIGLEILWGLVPDGDAWTGGRILDPETGSVYRVDMRLKDDGRILLVHGFIGIPLLGRTQEWLRDK